MKIDVKSTSFKAVVGSIAALGLGIGMFAVGRVTAPATPATVIVGNGEITNPEDFFDAIDFTAKDYTGFEVMEGDGAAIALLYRGDFLQIKAKADHSMIYDVVNRESGFEQDIANQCTTYAEGLTGERTIDMTTEDTHCFTEGRYTVRSVLDSEDVNVLSSSFEIIVVPEYVPGSVTMLTEKGLDIVDGGTYNDDIVISSDDDFILKYSLDGEEIVTTVTDGDSGRFDQIGSYELLEINGTEPEGTFNFEVVAWDGFTLINTQADIHRAFTDSRGSIKLGKDIMMSERHTPISKEGTATFKGEFDGNGYKIQNLYVEEETADSGFFGEIGADRNSATHIHDVEFTDANIIGAGSTGILAGSTIYNVNNQIRIDNVKVGGNVYGIADVGGLIGTANFHRNLDLAFSDIIVNADVTGGNAVGGIFGVMSIFSSKDSRTVTGKSISFNGLINGGTKTGGFSGSVWGVTVANGFVFEDIRINADIIATGQETGALIGKTRYTDFKNVYITGSIIGVGKTAGMFGNGGGETFGVEGVVIDVNAITVGSTGHNAGRAFGTTNIILGHLATDVYAANEIVFNSIDIQDTDAVDYTSADSATFDETFLISIGYDFSTTWVMVAGKPELQ